ncbi:MULTISPECIES: ABC transporter permease [unclassified Clostridium]|uniref:ABC transporter permease n=1 Tax=unclassified Clostridium TaxID=2614128 RepID=UPI000297543F|nr:MULTISPECIES: ABC transporter permease [unclassified Clostridium]EKQ56764.1 MAG: ABC-type multidrug transport system, permease component [Clostridium sp. Maddingley MBC34-26]
MINVVKGILYRMIINNTYLIMPLIITPIVIGAAIYFSSSFVERANIGVVGDYDVNFNSNEINVIRLEAKVPISELVKNKYEAVISFEDGRAVVDTIKDNDFKNKLERIANGEKVTLEDGEKRGIASNIVGYITMFVILLGVMLYRFFFDDKKGISKRVISSNISYEQYVLSHFISVFLMIFVPTVLITVLSKELLKLDTRVTTLELAFIILVLSLLSSAFGLFMSSVTKEMESASMLGTMINIITTLLAGSFFTVSSNNLINTIGNIMPQKHILSFTISLENGIGINYVDIISVIVVSLVMIVCSFLINRYKMRRYNYM